jgi:hypothetical protein
MSQGIFRLAPCWVPRSFLSPGGRLKLHPSDLYALGAHRGGIDERWIASTTRADNGPGTPEDEGLSYVVEGGRRTQLADVLETIGQEWNVLAKLFDNDGPIPHHLHQMDEHAARVGRRSKPEAYYFPPQLNTVGGRFPYTFFGLEPGTRKRDVRACLDRWDAGDNGILYLSCARKLKPGTGWQIDAGILHAPGTLVTYEVQRNSDVMSMFQSMVDERPVSRDLLVHDVPPELHNDLDYLVSMIDWDANLDPEFAVKRFRPPVPARPEEEMADCGYCEKWIAYGSRYYSAKELTVYPGRAAAIADAAAYGALVVQGRGEFGGLAVESPSVIRYGEMTGDELFVTAAAAREGIRIENRSEFEPLVILKHFGPAATA